jgi:hypothetical protein
MKRYLIFIILIFLFLPLGSLMGQTTENIQSAYVKNFLILKIYTHTLGFKVVYWTSNMDTASVYIPMAWFNDLDRKAVLVYGRDASYPYLSVIWVNNQISCLKIYAKEDTNDYTWGVLQDSPDLESKFKAENIELTY